MPQGTLFRRTVAAAGIVSLLVPAVWAAPNTGTRKQADPETAQSMIRACPPIAFIRRAIPSPD